MGEAVNSTLDRQNRHIPAIPEDTDLICSWKLARQLISHLESGLDAPAGGPLYIFSAEKRRVRIRLVRT